MISFALAQMRELTRCEPIYDRSLFCAAATIAIIGGGVRHRLLAVDVLPRDDGIDHYLPMRVVRHRWTMQSMSLLSSSSR